MISSPLVESQELRKRRGYDGKDAKGVSKTRLASMEDEENRHMLIGGDDRETTVTVTGKRGAAARGCGGSFEWPNLLSGL